MIWPSASEPSQLILSDYAVSCEQTNAELKAWTDASEALLDALDGGNDVRDACAEMSTLADLADARNAARPADRRVFAANFAAADGAEGVGTWTEDDDTWGILSYYSQTSGCDTWNRDTCSFDADAGSCVYQRWDAVDPVLEITHVGSAITGTFDAGLAEADTDEDAGTIHVEFHAPICSMEGLGDSIVAF